MRVSKLTAGLAGVAAVSLLAYGSLLAAPQPQVQSQTKLAAALKDVKVFSGTAKPVAHPVPPRILPGVGSNFTKVLSSTSSGSKIVLTPDHLSVANAASLVVDQPVEVFGGRTVNFNYMLIGPTSTMTLDLIAAAGKTYLFDLQMSPSDKPDCQYTIKSPGGDSQSVKCTVGDGAGQHLVFAYQASTAGDAEFQIKIAGANVNFLSATIAPLQ